MRFVASANAAAMVRVGAGTGGFYS
jgi:hypothetical protein